MNEQNPAQSITAGTTQAAPEWWPYAFGLFLLLIVVMVWNTKRRWSRIDGPFRTSIKPGRDEGEDQQVIFIDGRRFGNLMIAITQSGLYIAHQSFIPGLFGLRRALIPWSSLSDFEVKTQSVFGMTLSQYFTEARSPAGRVQLQLPSDVAELAISRGFMKKQN